jgi:uncharacterized protein (DUF58 family)
MRRAGAGWGNFALIAFLCAGSFALYQWRGGYSTVFLSCATGMLLVYALASALFSLRRVEVSRLTDQSRYLAGDDAAVTVTVTRKGLPLGWLAVRDIWTDGSKEIRLSCYVRLDAGRKAEFQYKISRLSRGAYRLVRTELYAGDWFGLLRRSKAIAGACGFTVYPRPLPAGEAIGGTARDSGKAGKRQFESHSPVTSGIRDYIQGDPLSRIHWKSSAKTGEWRTRTAEPLESERTVILLDCRRSAYAGAEGAERFELAVRAAAGLAEYARSRGNEPLLAVGDRLHPFKREEERLSAYELLSRVRADGETPLAALWMKHAGGGYRPDRLMWCVTSEPDEAFARAVATLRGHRGGSTVWLVRGKSPLTARQERWRDELRAAGIRVYEIGQDDASAYAVGMAGGGGRDGSA